MAEVVVLAESVMQTNKRRLCEGVDDNQRVLTLGKGTVELMEGQETGSEALDGVLKRLTLVVDGLGQRKIWTVIISDQFTGNQSAGMKHT